MMDATPCYSPNKATSGKWTQSLTICTRNDNALIAYLKALLFNHFPIFVISLSNFPHEVVGFNASEVAMLAHGIGEILLMTLQQNVCLHIVVPHLFIGSVFLCQRHCIDDVACA